MLDFTQSEMQNIYIYNNNQMFSWSTSILLPWLTQISTNLKNPDWFIHTVAEFTKVLISYLC